jgi:hypothetical protein
MCSTVKLCVAKLPGLWQYSHRSAARARTTRRTAAGTCSIVIASALGSKLLEQVSHRHAAQPRQRDDRRCALRVVLLDPVDEGQKLGPLLRREPALFLEGAQITQSSLHIGREPPASGRDERLFLRRVRWLGARPQPLDETNDLGQQIARQIFEHCDNILPRHGSDSHLLSSKECTAQPLRWQRPAGRLDT